MSTSLFQEVAEDIYCIDTALYRPGLAACYLVRSDDRLAFLDTGTARALPRLLATVEALGLDPSHVDYVIPTHVHLDHAGCSGDLMARCPRATLIVHPKGAPHLIDPAKLIAGATAVYGEEGFRAEFGGLIPVPEARVRLASDGDRIELAGRVLTFVDTPGHANHHGCLFDERTQGWFTGDTFGIAYQDLVGAQGRWIFAPTTPVAFDPDQWLASLDRLMAVAPRAMYLTHFGRLDEPESHLEPLRQSIRALAALALAEAAGAESGRGERLRAAVGAHLIRSARDHGVSLPETRIRELLTVDIELNAQGLEVWLQRRQRASA